MTCATPGYRSPFLSGLLNYLDCQATSIGAVGYQGLAAPESGATSIFAASLSIFIAILGIRLIIGERLRGSDLVSATFKVGIALTLTTTWLAYRNVLYDPILRGPSEVSAIVGRPAGLPGSGSDLIARLQNVDDMIVAFTNIGTGRLDRASPAGSNSTVVNDASGPSRTPISDDIALGLARLAYLVGTVGALGFVRLVSGLLLAVAPLVAGLLLFRATEGIFFGWLRMLVAMALTAYLVSAILMVQLSVAEPWLASTLSLRSSYYATPSAPIELLALMLAFTLILLLVTSVGVRIAFGQAPGFVINLSQFLQTMDSFVPLRPRPELPRGAPNTLADAQAGRVGRLADSLVHAQQRETRLLGSAALSPSSAEQATGPSATVLRSELSESLGQRFRKTPRRVVAPQMRGSGL